MLDPGMKYSKTRNINNNYLAYIPHVLAEQSLGLLSFFPTQYLKLVISSFKLAIASFKLAITSFKLVIATRYNQF